MGFVYEVTEQERMYEWTENEKLWDSQEKAERDLHERINRIKSEVRLVTNKDELIEEWDSVDSIEIVKSNDEEDIILRAYVYHYPLQFEIEDEPLSSSYISIKVRKRDVL